MIEQHDTAQNREGFPYCGNQRKNMLLEVCDYVIDRYLPADLAKAHGEDLCETWRVLGQEFNADEKTACCQRVR